MAFGRTRSAHYNPMTSSQLRSITTHRLVPGFRLHLFILSPKRSVFKSFPRITCFYMRRLIREKYSFTALICSQFSRDSPYCSLTPILIPGLGCAPWLQLLSGHQQAKEQILGGNPFNCIENSSCKMSFIIHTTDLYCPLLCCISSRNVNKIRHYLCPQAGHRAVSDTCKQLQ